MSKPRTHPRLTLEFEVAVRVAGSVLRVRSYQLGGGGMAFRGAEELQVSQPIELHFQIPDGPVITIPAIVWWKEKGLVGVRFDVSSPQREAIDHWVRKRSGEANYFAKPI